MTIQHQFGRDGRAQAVRFLLPRLGMILVLATLLLYAIAVSPGVPYHVQQLFGPSPSLLQAVAFALLVLFALAPPAYLGLQLIRLPGHLAWVFPVGLLAHAVVVFLAFRLLTPIASVHDLVGEPVWAIGDEWERLIRFTALFMGISTAFSGGSALLYGLIRSYAPSRLLWWLGYALVVLAATHWFVVEQASTGKLVALMQDSFPMAATIGLALWLLLLAFAGALLAARVARVFENSVATAFGVLLMLPLSYGLVFLATEEGVGGAASTLSALAFLLSADQGEYVLDATTLFSRYAVGYLVVVLLLAFSQYPLWLVYAARRFQVRLGEAAAGLSLRPGGGPSPPARSPSPSEPGQSSSAQPAPHRPVSGPSGS